MRILASLEHYALLGGDARVVLHQYMTGRYAAAVADGEVRMEVDHRLPVGRDRDHPACRSPGESVGAGPASAGVGRSADVDGQRHRRGHHAK